MTGKKMQSYNFRNVHDFLSYLPEKDLEITEFLREKVYECIPSIKEKLSYSVPFFYRFKTICFIWPGIIKWGAKQSYEGVRLGFVHGDLLVDDWSYLKQDNRKHVFWKDFQKMEDIDENLLTHFLYEASVVDQGFSEK